MGQPSVHLATFPDELTRYRDDALAAKWKTIRDVRRVVTGALELERAAKHIGSSLEASPVVYVSDRQMLGTLFDIDLAEVCITSNYEVQRRRRAGRRFPLERRARRGRGRRKGRGQEMRPLVEDSPHRRRGSPNTPTCRRATPWRCANGRRWE